MEKVGYYSRTTWGMFTEFNNSKCHHFIGFMDGCLCLSHHAVLSPSVSHTHAHLYNPHSNPPTCNNYHGTYCCNFMERWQGVLYRGLLNAVILSAIQRWSFPDSVPLLHSPIRSLKPHITSVDPKQETFEALSVNISIFSLTFCRVNSVVHSYNKRLLLSKHGINMCVHVVSCLSMYLYTDRHTMHHQLHRRLRPQCCSWKCM